MEGVVIPPFFMKEKKCKNCGDKFTPRQPLQYVCGFPCAIEYAKKQREKKETKEWKKEKKERTEKLMTHKDWLKAFQQVFNTYIRLRDKDLPCISCGTKINNSGHASHFFSVGSYPNLRFNEDNVWRSCIECNLHKHGNTAEYSIRLKKHIGEERFNKLLELRKEPLKLSVPEVQEQIKIYKEKIKTLKHE